MPNKTPAGGPRIEGVAVTRRQPNETFDLLRPVEIPDDAHWLHAMDEIICRETARGTIVARLQEIDSMPTLATVIARPEGGALVVFSNRYSSMWQAYEAHSVEIGTGVSRQILQSGTAFNWS